MRYRTLLGDLMQEPDLNSEIRMMAATVNPFNGMQEGDGTPMRIVNTYKDNNGHIVIICTEDDTACDGDD